MSETIETKSQVEESKILEQVMASYLNCSLRSPIDTDITKDDLDRTKAEQQYIEDISNATDEFINKSPGVMGAYYAVRQNEQRVRRDINISRQTHKRLMQGCLETMYRRLLKAKKDSKAKA